MLDLSASPRVDLQAVHALAAMADEITAQGRRPVLIEHSLKFRIGVRLTSVGAARLLVVHPSQNDNFFRTRITKEKPVPPLKEFSPLPVPVVWSERVTLPEG